MGMLLRRHRETQSTDRETQSTDVVDVESMTLDELKAAVAAKGIPLPSRSTKSKLMALLKDEANE